KFMSLERAKIRAQLLKEIREAVKEAETAGVFDAKGYVGKIIKVKHFYITWKSLIKEPLAKF
ncbi:MAG: hypothetical protein WAU47_09570, partial [Desulfobaccales bacterium]